MLLGGTWGVAYGQTGGPTPTPGPGILAVSKSVDNQNPRRGDTVTFTIRVSNTGGKVLRNVEVLDVMPGTFQVLGATATKGTVTQRGQTIRVSIPELAPGETVLVTAQARIRNNARGTLRNNVVVRAQDVAGVSAGEQNASAVLGVSEESADDAAGGRGRGVGNEAGGGPQYIGNQGVDTTLRWPLMIGGMFLVAMGGLVFMRARRIS